MTECDRILTKGVIPAAFLKEETRCGFFVDTTRKKLWTIQLDLLMELDRICKNNGLQYFAAYGTLLGAVRHQGFIPWDDDADVWMLRDDYNKLSSISNQFSSPYFLQNAETDPNYFMSFSKLRNDNTTCVRKTNICQGFHAGISIDIFPLDNTVPATGQEIYNRIKYLNMENSTYMRMKDPNPSEEDKRRISMWSKIHPQEAYNEIQNLAQKNRNIETEHVSKVVCTIYPYGKDILKKEWFKDQSLLEFESMKIPVPIGYREVLSQIYGEYMKFPPLNERGSWHPNSKLIIDPDIPYSIKINALLNNSN